MQLPRFFESRKQTALRIALSYYVTNGLSAALGLALISGVVHLLLGQFAAAAASVGVVVCIPPDQPAPRRGKFWQLLPAAVIGLPLFFGVQVLHASPLGLGLLLVPASFMAFLAGAWGKRGLPIAISVMFAMIFSMAVPDHTNSATNLATCLYFALGAISYLIWATFANAALNSRYRVQMLAGTLYSLARLMRTQAQQFAPKTSISASVQTPLIGALLQQQASLADELQSARDLLLEAPRTSRRQQLAHMLIRVLEMRDHLLVCELDLDTLRTLADQEPALTALRDILDGLAGAVEHLADTLLFGRAHTPFVPLRPQLAGLQWGAGSQLGGQEMSGPSPDLLALGLASRIGYLSDEVLHLVDLAREKEEPDVGLVRTNWQLFVSPTVWSWQPILAAWRWNGVPLRHAIRAALAIGTAYTIGLALPWGTHDYWILLTIVVVLRGSLAQTLERRNSRAAGTLIGCLLAGSLLSSQAPHWILLVIVILAQALSHGFAAKRYLVTAIAATVLGLLQVHMLNTGASPSFDVIERMSDTLIGVAIAWAFSYVFPSWERTQIAGLVTRALEAQARHAREALGLWQLDAVDNEPELRSRLARREAYDSLSALVQATQRSLSEPRAVRPPLEPLARLLAYSYQLQAQLTTVKTMMLQRRGRLTHAQIDGPLRLAAQSIETTLGSPCGSHHCASPALSDSSEFCNPFEGDLTPWLLRRLELASDVAMRLRSNADQVFAEVEVVH